MPDVSLSEQPVLEALISIRHRLGMLKKDRQKYYKASDIISLYDELCAQIAQVQAIRRRDHKDEDVGFRNRVDDVIDDVYQLFSLFWMALGKNKEIPATYVQLVTIKQSLELFNDLGFYTADDLKPYSKRLSDINMIICQSEETKTPAMESQFQLVLNKYRQCQVLMERLHQSLSTIDPELAPIQKKLVDIRRRLVVIAASDTKDSAAIHKIQRELREIDNMRSDGKFLAPDGSVPSGQAEIVGLLELCFDETHDLVACNDVYPGYLRPIFDRLVDIKTHLERLLLTHRWTLRETDLWGYQVQLAEIDAMRKNGKLCDGHGEPYEAQGSLNFLLHRCYHLIYILLSSSEPVAEALTPIHNQLRTLRRCFLEVKKYGGPFKARELYPYQLKLGSIDNMRVDGKFLDEEGNIPEGQGVVMSLLNECYDIMYEMLGNVED